MIEVNNLKRQFITYERGTSLKEVVVSLFNRKESIVHALKGLSFAIGEGELVGFLGPNGAGKS
ncbi:MAG TPA: ABC transporter, partial [Bacilli bacterium]